MSGGNEVRTGAHRGMAIMAADLAGAGFPVFRYDRRGIGDSTGTNVGFLSSEADITAAVAAFRTVAPRMSRIVGFGNCDAASALALFGRGAGIDRVLLANPWTIEDRDDLPPVAAIRAHYADRMLSPAAWLRLVRGGIDIGKAVRGLAKIARHAPGTSNELAPQVVAAIAAWGTNASVVLARGDATAIAYRAVAGSLPSTTLDTDSHSFARAADKVALRAILVDLLGSTR